MRIDPLRLLRLHELIKQRSFRKAADSLCITQSALSQSITQMESEVGVRLIDRTSHGVVPTIFGEALVRHATEIEWQLSEAAKRISELAFGQQGLISVGGTSGSISVVTLTIRRLRERNRECDVRLIEESWTRELMHRVEDRSLDAAICSQPDDLEMEGKIALPLFQGRRVLCVRANHPEAGNLTLKAVEKYPFVCQGGEASASRDIKRIFNAFHVDFPSRQLIVSNSLAAGKDIVLNSDAFGIFTDVSLLNENKFGTVKCAELEETATAYWHYLVAREDLRVTELLADFVSILGAACRDLGVEVHPGIGRIQAGRMLGS